MPDAAVGKVVSAGFASDVAKWALANNSNDVAAAIRELKAVSLGLQHFFRAVPQSVRAVPQS